MTEIIKSHKDLDIWKRSGRLVKDIYILTNELPKSEDLGLITKLTEHLNEIVILRKQLSATISSLQRKLNNK